MQKCLDAKGVGKEPLNINKGRKFSLGLGYWGIKIISVFMSSQSSVSLGTAQLLAGHQNVIRIDPVMPSNRFGIDTIEEIKALKGLGDSEARKFLPELRELFFNERTEKFDPFHNF